MSTITLKITNPFQNSNKITSNLDRQSNAIYAFTIVTIIFLPLSFVSSFLGMNTADIRNMGSTQWLFWAAGIPLTVIIILMALLWAGELGNMGGWLLKWVSRRTGIVLM